MLENILNFDTVHRRFPCRIAPAPLSPWRETLPPFAGACRRSGRRANFAAMKKSTPPDSPKLFDDLPLRPDFSIEEAARTEGLWPIAGTDEAGRGPLAGPVVAAAVILDPENIPAGLNDSKKTQPETA